MLFSEILDSIRFSEAVAQVTVSDDWSQGRATYGGLVAAVGNTVMRALVPADRPLRSLQTTFVGPAGPTTWRIDARVLRVGKAVTLARCDIFDGEQMAATVVGVYGRQRSSSVDLRPVAVPTATHEPFDVWSPMLQPPVFLQHFAIRWTAGAQLFSGSTRAATQAFIRHRDGAPLTESHVVGLIDCIPSPALGMIDKAAPASSLVWTLEFFEHRLDFAPEQWWRIDTTIDAATGGYANQTGLLHDPNGKPVALSRQLVAVFG